jgi:hypothetical protein
MNETYKIIASLGVAAELSGVGEEWLYDITGEYVIARFWNGSMITLNSPLSQNSSVTDDTVVLSDAA